MDKKSTEQKLDDLRILAKNIRLVATDLDGTLLNSHHQLTETNRAAIGVCVEKGMIICTATGRARTSIPDEIVKLPGMKYLITANGARIYAAKSGEILHESFLSEAALEYVRPFLFDEEVMCEYFWDGTAHVDEELFRNAGNHGIPKSFSDYFLATRIPTPDYAATVQANSHKIENVNFVFDSDQVKKRIGDFLGKREDLYELTTSLAFNYEIGGKGVSKAAAVDYILNIEGMQAEDAIAFGDNSNDASMLLHAGIGVAPSNAVHDVLAIADYITDDNNSDGFAKALQMLEIIS